MNETAIKWYKYLQFPSEFDEEFYALAESKDISGITPENCVKILCEKKDYGLNLIYFLSQLDNTKAAMDERNIDEKYFRATAMGLVGEAKSCKETFGKIGVYEVGWTNAVMKGTYLFRIGRLNFGLETLFESWCDDGKVIKLGDTIIAVHIPGGGKLDETDAYRSLLEAERFFKKHFPEKDIKGFMCGSWLLDRTLDNFLKPDSNIIKFRDLFTPYMKKEDYSAIKFAFGKNITKDNLKDFEPKNSFQAKLKEHVLSGGKLYDTFGFRPFQNADVAGIDCHYHQMQWHTDDMSVYPKDYLPECGDTGDIVKSAQAYMELCNLQGVNVLCMPNMEDLFGARDESQNILGAVAKMGDSRIYAFGGLYYPEYPVTKDYGFKEQAKTLLDMGFDGIKLIETKPNAYKKIGTKISGEIYDDFFNYLEEENIHIICHATDQVSHRAEVRAGNENLEKMYALCEEIYEDVLLRLEKNPDLKITLAHFFFMAEELDRLSAVLDKYPNVCIDTTPAERELHYLSETPEKTRAFFRKYADRIMLGTDDKNAFHTRYKEVQLAMLDRYLRTPDSFTTKWGNKLVGVDLDRDDLEKVLYKNFRHRTGETPKVIDKALLKEYIEKMLPLIPESKTKEEINKFANNL